VIFTGLKTDSEYLQNNITLNEATVVKVVVDIVHMDMTQKQTCNEL